MSNRCHRTADSIGVADEVGRRMDDAVDRADDEAEYATQTRRGPVTKKKADACRRKACEELRRAFREVDAKAAGADDNHALWERKHAAALAERDHAWELARSSDAAATALSVSRDEAVKERDTWQEEANALRGRTVTCGHGDYEGLRDEVLRLQAVIDDALLILRSASLPTKVEVAAVATLRRKWADVTVVPQAGVAP